MSIPHSEDVPNIQTAGSQMSFVLQPFNYFNSDPSLEVDDAMTVSTAPQPGGTLVYERHGDVDDDGHVITRDVDCLPVMVRTSAAARYHTHVMMTMMMTMMIGVYGLRHC